MSTEMHLAYALQASADYIKFFGAMLLWDRVDVLRWQHTKNTNNQKIQTCKNVPFRENMPAEANHAWDRVVDSRNVVETQRVSIKEQTNNFTLDSHGDAHIRELILSRLRTINWRESRATSSSNLKTAWRKGYCSFDTYLIIKHGSSYRSALRLAPLKARVCDGEAHRAYRSVRVAVILFGF